MDIQRRLPASLELTCTALVLALRHRHTARRLRRAAARAHGRQCRDECSARSASVVPTFVSGLLLIYVFYYLLGWAPRSERRGIDIFASPPPDITGFYLIDFALAGDWRRLRGPAFTPADAAGAHHGAVRPGAARPHDPRVDAGGAVGSDFIRTAHAMGLPRLRIIVAYALRNALLPVITITGHRVLDHARRQVLVEKVFSWPGVASYALDALLASRLRAGAGLRAADGDRSSCCVNVTIDVLYGIADPRVSVDMSDIAPSHGPLEQRRHDAYVLRSNPVTAVAASAPRCWSCVAVFAPRLAPYEPVATDVPNALQPPVGARTGPAPISSAAISSSRILLGDPARSAASRSPR